MGAVFGCRLDELASLKKSRDQKRWEILLPLFLPLNQKIKAGYRVRPIPFQPSTIVGDTTRPTDYNEYRIPQLTRLTGRMQKGTVLFLKTAVA
jgi:hypothetical protein